MKLQLIPAFLLIRSGAHAFAPVVGRFGTHVVAATSRTTARSFGLDPSSFQDLSQHVDSFRDAFTSLTLSDVDLDPSAIIDTAAPAAIDPSAIIDTAAPAAIDAATDASTTAASSKSGGWFGFLTGPIQGLLVLIHSGMVAMGVSSNAWGISIIILTLFVKAVTFPLTKTQLESTNKMQVCFQFILIGLFYRFIQFYVVSSFVTYITLSLKTLRLCNQPSRSSRPSTKVIPT